MVPFASAPQRSEQGPPIKRPFHVIRERLPEVGTFLWHVNSLAALMHPPSSTHALPKSGLTLKASCVVSPVNTLGPVRLPLRPSPDHLYITLSLSGYPPWSRRRPCGSQILPLSSFTACHHRYPGFLAGALSHFFPASNGLHPSRKGSASSRPLVGLSLTPGSPSK